MIEVIALSIPGDPRTQKRHRDGKYGGKYDPSAESKRTFLDLAYEHKPEKPFNQPICVKINFYFSRPKSHFGTGKNADNLKDSAPIWCDKKPDIDNIQKFVYDSFKGVFWTDDSLICRNENIKQYSNNPRTEISIFTL